MHTRTFALTSNWFRVSVPELFWRILSSEFGSGYSTLNSSFLGAPCISPLNAGGVGFFGVHAISDGLNFLDGDRL